MKDRTIKNPIFGTTSIELAEELATRIDLAQLRHELHVAEINTHFDDDDCGF
jgi:hypothetical protein